MSRLFRSKSCGLVDFNSAPPTPFFHNYKNDEEEGDDDDDDDNEEEEEEEEEKEKEEEEKEELDRNADDMSSNPISTPFISLGPRFGAKKPRRRNGNSGSAHIQFPILDILVAALRKSLVTCSVEPEDVSSMDIGWPTEVRHVSHVTFDRFNGFLGLPTELEPDVPRRVPSASASVFGVSAKSMQCSYDGRGNSVPMILLMMQKRLYAEGGLKAEGIFRINPDNSQEEYVRSQLNKGLLPLGIDVHCLAGLIKAWFRELPTGVLDSLTPEQVMHCNTEDDCAPLVTLLPSTEAALLDWAINLMADVVQQEQHNKMNARNIAMVFAPNMTQMADPLTALIHAVQVMNFLKTLILKNIREREEAAAEPLLLLSCSDFPTNESDTHLSKAKLEGSCEPVLNSSALVNKFLRTATLSRLESNSKEKLIGSLKKSDEEDEFESVSGSSPATLSEMGSLENGCRGGYDGGDWLRLRKGMRRLCRHPVFQLSKRGTKTRAIGIVNTRGRGGEAWV